MREGHTPTAMARPATLCYIRKDGHTLMVYRNKKKVDLHQGMYVAPGGKMEPEDEGSLERTMRRETEEETGLTPKDYYLKGFLTFINDDRVFSDKSTAKMWGKKWDVAVYIAGDYEGELDEKETEGRLEWVPDDKITELDMHEGDKKFTPWLDRPEYFIAKFHYLEDNLDRMEKEFFKNHNEFLEKVRETYGDCL